MDYLITHPTLTISDFKMDVLSPVEVQEITFLLFRSDPSQITGVGRQELEWPKEKYMDFRARQTWLCWLSRLCDFEQVTSIL